MTNDSLLEIKGTNSTGGKSDILLKLELYS